MSISAQFHALPSEIPELLAPVFQAEDVFKSELLESSTAFHRLIGGAPVMSDHVSRVLAFTLSTPQLEAKNAYEFALQNPGALLLEVSALVENQLRESWLHTMTREPDILKRWTAAARRLRSRTMTGAIAVSPVDGATGPMSWHRFTVGAQKAFATGVVIRPGAGNVIIRLPGLL